jgi:hypothetical protein
MMRMTGTTTCSFLAMVGGEGLTIHLELVQALGQRSPRGTFKILGLLTFILHVSPRVSLGFAFCFHPPMCIWIMIYHSHLYEAWIFSHFCSLGRAARFHLHHLSGPHIIACELFVTIILDLDLRPARRDKAGLRSHFGDPCHAYRRRHAIAVYLELWSHHYIPQIPVSSSMPGRSWS